MRLDIKVPSIKIQVEKKQTKQVMRAAASEVASAIRRLVRTAQGSGRRYGSHTASAPGKPPTSRTGALAGSIRTKVRQRDNTITASIRDTMYYALFLEKGATGGGGKKGNRNTYQRKKRVGQSTKRVLEPRPFMYTVLEAKEASITQRVRDAITQDIKFVKQR